MAFSIIGPKFYAWDRNGKPLAFGKLYTYRARTNAPKATYQSEDAVVENTNPVILNGEGYANVYLDGSYKVVLKDSDDNEIWSADPVTSPNAEEWVNCLQATYVNATTFKIAGNFVEEYDEGRSVRLDSGSTTYAYSTISSSTFAAGETTVVIKDPVVSVNLETVCSSIIGVESVPKQDDRYPRVLDTFADLSTSGLAIGELVLTRGRDAVNDGRGALYFVEAGTAEPYKDATVSSNVRARWLSGIAALTTRKEDVEFKPEDKYLKGHKALNSRGAFLVIGDSITEGVGASSYDEGYANKLARSFFRSIDSGFNEDRGYRFETIFNLANAIAQEGVSTTGVVSGGGSVDSVLTLAAGQTLTVTGRAVAFFDIFYGATSSTATGAQFSRNGVVYDTKTITGAGTQTTFPTAIVDGDQSSRDTDTLTLTAIGGTIVVTGLLTLRKSSNSALMYINGKSGWGYEDHALQSRVDAVADHINLLGPATETLCLINLGTNNIYNPSKALSPANYVAAIDDLINKYSAALTKNVNFVISVPPKAAPPTATVTGDAYLEYVKAIIEYAEANQRQLLRLDKTGLSGVGTLLDDTIHPNDEGHNILAKEICRTLGIPYNPLTYKTTDEDATVVVEVSSQQEEDAAFASGALAVIRLDLIGPRSSLFMDFENPPTWEDLSQFGHTITPVGSPSITNSVTAPVGSYVANLIGDQNFLYTDDDPSLRLTQGASGWGMEAYIRLNTVNDGNNKFLFSKGTQSNLNDQWYLALVWSATLGAYNITFSGSNNVTMASIPYAFSADTDNFHHISVNSDGTTVRIYVDGSLVGSVPQLNIYDGGGLLYIGSWVYTVDNTDCGYMDQIVITNEGPLRNGDFTPPNGG
ncbi:SGNH hydrolase-type esterase domain protein [Vibrio phage 1.211.B._10N.222.52.F11]|nr:SGNH hydrolase-type esterase domain protein [Vibrio phage 1.211.A._10N.222.52.F11]AUR95751.1 SGNH hydrolase-type esterase domain protein [Vibrio phage 1.211.B._10N.222.52.F11]